MSSKSIDEIRTIAHNWEGPKSICYCGHNGDGYPSQHSDHTKGYALIVGHGPCKVRGCECKRFTWEKFTPEFDEATR